MFTDRPIFIRGCISRVGCGAKQADSLRLSANNVFLYGKCQTLKLFLQTPALWAFITPAQIHKIVKLKAMIIDPVCKFMLTVHIRRPRPISTDEGQKLGLFGQLFANNKAVKYKSPLGVCFKR